MNVNGDNLKPVSAIGLGCLGVAAFYLLSLGKAQILVCSTLGSIGAVCILWQWAKKPLRIDKAAALGAFVGIIGAVLAFNLLGSFGKMGWRPAEDLTELSQTYEGRGLSGSEISLVYNIYVGEPIFNGVTLQLFFIVGLVGLLSGGLTALALGGFRVRGASYRETLYNLKILYRPGEKLLLPSAAKWGFRISFIPFLGIFTSMFMYAISVLLYELFSSHSIAFVSYLGAIFVLNPLVVISGGIAFLGYAFTVFLFPLRGNYAPWRIKAGAMAVFSLLLVYIFISVFAR